MAVLCIKNRYFCIKNNKKGIKVAGMDIKKGRFNLTGVFNNGKTCQVNSA